MADTKYVNVYVNNDSDIVTPIDINIDFPQAVIDEPQKYKMSVVKFMIDSNSIPIVPFVKAATAADGTDINRSVTVMYQTGAGAFHYTTVNIIWLPSVYNGEKNIYYYHQYDFQRIFKAINTAYATAFTTLNAFGCPNNPPVFSLNKDTQKIECTLNTAIVAAINNANTVEFPTLPVGEAIYICADVGISGWLNYFANLRVEAVINPLYPPELNSILRFSMYPLTVATQTISQYQSSLDRIRQVTNLVMSSDMPVVKESFPTFECVSGVVRTTNAGAGNTANILAEYTLSGSDQSTSAIIVYLPTAQFRYISLNGTTPLNRFRLRMEYVVSSTISSTLPRILPVYLERNGVFNCKILFEKKQGTQS